MKTASEMRHSTPMDYPARFAAAAMLMGDPSRYYKILVATYADAAAKERIDATPSEIERMAGYEMCRRAVDIRDYLLSDEGDKYPIPYRTQARVTAITMYEVIRDFLMERKFRPDIKDIEHPLFGFCSELSVRVVL